jgi:hypothetical protein
MIEIDEPYFEITDTRNLIRIVPIDRIDYKSNIDWDKNWIKVKFTLKGGKFSGEYFGEIMTVDLQKFLNEFSLLYDNLSGSASFNDLEGFLDLKIKGDGLGHFDANITARDQPGIDSSELSFKMLFDQTILKDLKNQLEEIVEKYPVIGDLKNR